MSTLLIPSLAVHRIIYAYTAMATARAAVANMYQCFYCSNLIQEDANRHGDGTDHSLAGSVERGCHGAAYLSGPRSWMPALLLRRAPTAPYKAPPTLRRGALGGEPALQRLPPQLPLYTGGVETPPMYRVSFNSPYISNHTVSSRY